MYVYVNVCIYECMYVCVCVYIYMFINIYIYICVCVCKYQDHCEERRLDEFACSKMNTV